MKWFLITLAIGLAASDKLDRTYLPPPGAQFSGGNLGDLDAPLAPPHHSGPVVEAHEGPQTNFGLNGEPVEFGDKIPKVPFNYYPEKVPTTTTSFAFSQTTTYPPAEGYETTALPINPITGLSVQLDQASYPYGPSQGQQNIDNLPSYTQNQGQGAPTYGTNIQPGSVPQSSTSGLVFDRPSYGQPSSQYPGQNAITPEGTNKIPGSVYQVPVQNQGQIQYPGAQSIIEQQGILPTGIPGNQRYDQYPGQNVVSPGDTVRIPAGNQGLIQYPGGQTIAGQQGFVPSTASSSNLQPSDNQYGVNYDGSQGQFPQGTYSGQPINVQNLGERQPSQTSYQNQEPFNVGGLSSQYPTGNQNLISGPGGPENVYQSGSTPSTIPSSYYNGVSSTTPIPGVPSSTSVYSSVEPVYRPERPQAAADRNAVILNYENVLTPNGYSYSFDTSNGIHADESGIVDNGTKAQGSYSYTGDDGKVYKVIYTADENGFRPYGDHLPTPPPIPEAIQRVIEQAARDKAAGIVDDGSYDEAKYGDKKYQGTTHRHRPQNQGANRLNNEQSSAVQDDQIKPVAGIHDADYDEDIAQEQFNNNLPVTGTRKKPSGKLPSNQVNNDNNAQNEGNRRVSGKDGITLGTNKQVSSGPRPMSIGDNLPYTGATDTNQNDLLGSQNRGSSGRRPTSDAKDMQTKYPGAGDSSKTDGNGFGDSEDQDINSGSPSLADGTNENIKNNFDSVSGNTQVPVIGNRKQTLRQRVKGNSQNTNGRPQGENFIQESTDTPSISDYIKNNGNQPIPNQQGTQQDDTGYHYQQPNPKFEQNKFPSRFSPQEASSTVKPDQRRTEYVKGETRKPFITPNVYNQNDETRQSTTRRPFMTIGVTSPTDRSYTDYDDGDDYATDQDVDDDRIGSTGNPAEKSGITSRPYQSTTSRLQSTPSGFRTRVTQKSTVTPVNRIENSGTVTPGYNKYGSTTPMPSHNSRFGSTETPRKMKPQQRKPSTTVPDSTTAVGRPVTSQPPSGTTISDYKYQTTGPVSKYYSTNVVPGYPATGSVPGYDSVSLTPGSSTPQGYPSSTYRPSQDYSSTTAVPPTSGYKQVFGSLLPSQAPVSQPSPTGIFHTGYHYGPPKIDYSTTISPNPERPGPGFFTPSGTPGVYPTSLPGTYQQGPNGFPSTTSVPSTPRRQGTFILSQPGNTAPEFSPIGTYQGNVQNGPSTPDYSTTIVSSTPSRPIFGYQGSTLPSNPQVTTGYEYEPSRPTYSPSIIGTTPGSFVPSGTPGAPTQGYSTSDSPGFQTTKDTFVSGPLVDGFGRPITTEQGGSQPGFSYPGPGSIGPNFGFNEQSTAYPGSYDQSRVIGEDFSGPKQPQRYDPKTGYHYK